MRRDALASADLTKVLYSFRCFRARGEPGDPPADTLRSGLDRVADMLAWVPHTAFAKLGPRPDVGGILSHEAFDYLVPRVGDNIRYLLPNDRHDSDPGQDFNPLYKLASRSEYGDVWSDTMVYHFKSSGVCRLAGTCDAAA